MAYLENRFVISQLTRRELKRKYARSRLGIVWSVLAPLLSMVILSLIFSQLFKRSIENYPIYYLSGYLIWQALTGATTSAMTALVDNRALLLKIKFPMEIFLVTRVYTAFINLLYSLVAYALMLLVFRIPLSFALLAAPLLFLFVFVFSLGLSYMLATAYVFFGDVKHLYSVFLTLWMYVSAIFYPAEQLSGFIYEVIRVNPVYQYIHALRTLVLGASLPDASAWLYMLAWSLAAYRGGRALFNRYRARIMQKL